MVYKFFVIKQANFFKTLGIKTKLSHGGVVGKGKRKTRRPLDVRKPLHLVMKAEKAKGHLNFLRAENSLKIKRVLQKQSAKFGVKISAYANVGNHLHLMISFSSRRGLQNFLRSSAALIARAITRARRGVSFGKFWDALAFTRVISSSKEKAILVKYIAANFIEAKFGRKSREEFLLKRNRWEERVFAN